MFIIFSLIAALEDVQNTVGCDLETLKLIRDALKQPLGYDLREG